MTPTDQIATHLTELLDASEAELGRPLTPEEAESVCDVALSALDDDEEEAELQEAAIRGRGRWVTMPADGDGGSPVYLDKGKITKGPAKLKGKKPSEIEKQAKTPKKPAARPRNESRKLAETPPQPPSERPTPPAPPRPEWLPGDAEIEQAMRDPRNVRELTGGSSGGKIVKVGDKEYILKEPRTPGGPSSIEEAWGSEFAETAGVDVARVARVEWQGQQRNIAEFVPGTQALDDLALRSDAAARSALQRVPKAAIERQALYDYVIGNFDTNDGNYLVKGDRLIGIDKEYAFRSDANFSAPDHLRFLTRDGMVYGYEFSAPEVTRMADVADQVGQALEQRGEAPRAKWVRKRGQALRDLLRGYAGGAGQPMTVQRLEQHGQDLTTRRTP